MSTGPGDNLTRELAAIGFPNPFAGLRLTRKENVCLFGRAYLGNMTVSDTVTTPHGQELYGRCADGDEATTLIFDETGEHSRRPAPPEGRIYAVVQSPTHSLFWDRIEAAVNLKSEGEEFIMGDEFAAIYGLPDTAEQIPEPEQLPPE